MNSYRVSCLASNVLLFAFAILLSLSGSVFAQGSLTPPSAPAPTMKTLAQIEPRTPISTAPFTISTAGSYYLTTNLTGTAGQSGVIISASDVTLDLNGFALVGGVSSLNGVSIGSARTNITIRNGSIRGWGSYGIDAGFIVNSRLMDLNVSANIGRGIYVGDGNVVSGCAVRNNGSTGLLVGDACRVVDCVAVTNGADGIYAENGTTVSGCAAHNNAGSGLRMGTAGRVLDCTVAGNGSSGIHVGSGGAVSGCSAFFNGGNGMYVSDGSTVTGCSSRSNVMDGIVGIIACRVVDCTSSRNGDDGVNLGSGSSCSRCSAYDNNDRGITISFGGTITDCVAYSNAGTGIYAISSSILQCNAYQNQTNGIVGSNGRVAGCIARSNTGNGIVADNSQVENNNCVGNTLAAIRITSSQSRVENNNCGGGQRGIQVTSPDNMIIRNTVTSASVLAYDIVAGNNYGTINVLAGGAIITTGNSFANFEY